MSGKYLNVLGKYSQCLSNNDSAYILTLINVTNYNDKVNSPKSPTYIVGNCIVKECASNFDDFFNYYNKVYYLQEFREMITNSNQVQKLYYEPDAELRTIKDESYTGFLVMLSFLLVVLILSIAGTIV